VAVRLELSLLEFSVEVVLRSSCIVEMEHDDDESEQSVRKSSSLLCGSGHVPCFSLVIEGNFVLRRIPWHVNAINRYAKTSLGVT